MLMTELVAMVAVALGTCGAVGPDRQYTGTEQHCGPTVLYPMVQLRCSILRGSNAGKRVSVGDFYRLVSFSQLVQGKSPGFLGLLVKKYRTET